MQKKKKIKFAEPRRKIPESTILFTDSFKNWLGISIKGQNSSIKLEKFNSQSDICQKQN